jgi:hypothetical protein
MAESIETLIARITNPKLRERYVEMAISSAHAEALNHIREYSADDIERLADAFTEHNQRKKAFELVTHPAYLAMVNDTSAGSDYDVIFQLTVGKNTKLFVRTQCESKAQFEKWYGQAIMQDGTRDPVNKVFTIMARGITERQAKRITGMLRWGPYKGFMPTSDLERIDRSKDSAAALSGLPNI